GERLAVVAGACGDDALRALISQRGDLRERTSKLEGPGSLEVLGLQRDRRPRPLAQRPRGEHRGPADELGAGLGGMANFVKRDGGRRLVLRELGDRVNQGWPPPRLSPPWRRAAAQPPQ